MTRTYWKRRRTGVTLIEILVVLAIIGILLALTSAALQKTVEGQNVKTSETQVFKLQQALDQEYDRVVAKCAQDATNEQIPPEIVNVCDGNKARAKAVWTAFQLRLNFPDSFAEAAFPALTIYDSTNTAVYSIPRPTTFAALAVFATAPADTFEQEEESGALLYMILAKRSVSGGGAMATSAEDLTQASRRKVTFRYNGNEIELETFADAFKRSVGFRRWEQTMATIGRYGSRTAINNESRYDLRDRQNILNPADPPYNPAKWIYEVQKSPYVDPAKSHPANVNRDPLDPQGLVPGWADNLPANDQRRIIREGVIPLNATPNAPLVKTGLYFNGQNRMPTVYSLGKIKETLPRPALPAVPRFMHDDDILGFRLRKSGERGFKQ